MTEEVAVKVTETEKFDLVDTAYFVKLNGSEETDRINDRVPKHFLANRKNTLVKIVRFQRRSPIIAWEIERHLSCYEFRIQCAPAIKSLFLIGRADCDISDSNDIRDKFRWVKLDGATGVVLEPGVWHSTQCFPVASEYCQFLFLLDAECESDFERNRREPFTSAYNELVNLTSRAHIIPS